MQPLETVGQRAAKTVDRLIGIADDKQIAVAAPLKKEEEDYAYLIGSYKYDLLNDVLGNINIGANGGAYIINEKGDIIADRDVENMSTRNNIYELYGSKKNNKFLDAMTNFQTGAAGMRMHGIYHYAAYSPVAGTNWTLVVDAPNSDFMGAVVFSLRPGLCEKAEELWFSSSPDQVCRVSRRPK